MNSHLDSLIAAARSDRPDWTPSRTATAITGAKTRVRRASIVRRALVVGGTATAIFLFVLRGASAPATVTADASPSWSSTGSLSGDGGYARD